MNEVRETTPRRRRRWLSVFATFVLVFTALRLALPFVVESSVNRVLRGLQEYDGSVDAVHVNLWRGAYEIDGLRLFRRDRSDEPMLEVKRVDLSLRWSALLHGRVVAEVVCHHPIVSFEARGEHRERDAAVADEPWTWHLDRLAPFAIDRFVVRDGEVRYRDASRSPVVDLYATDVYAEVLNLANVRDAAQNRELFTEVEVAARPFGTAELEARARLDPLAEPVRLEMDAAVREVQLTDLADWLRAYGAIDAEAGTLGVYSEFAAADGQVEGYVKTLFDGMRIVRYRDLTDPREALHGLWEALVSAAVTVLENQPHERLATKIPLRGTTNGTRADVLATLGNLLRNAFLAALGPAIDDSIDLRDMEVGGAVR